MRPRTQTIIAASAAIVLCLLVYWKAFFSWFQTDDFAWLGLPLEVHSIRDLLRALFQPQAQGTVRVFSERLYYLVLGGAFGLSAIPFKLVGFATAFANLYLIGRVTRRITDSPLAAAVAPLLYVLNIGLVLPMAWIAAYNELLAATVVLAAFVCFLRSLDTGSRRDWLAQWAIFLAGFGVLESVMVYPAVVTLYAALAARRHVRRTLWLWIPSAVFGVVHWFLIPVNGPAYRPSFDAGMLKGLYLYFSWAVAPRRFALPHHLSSRIFVAVVLALAVFLFLRLRQREPRPVWMLAWFVLFLAPVLPFQGQHYEHYLAVPAIGLCMLGGWAFADAWRRPLLRPVAVVLAGAYAAGNWVLIERIVDWRYQVSNHMKDVVLAVQAAQRRTHRDTLVLDGADHELYLAGLRDEPFRLVGIQRTYIVPDSREPLVFDAGQPYAIVASKEFAPAGAIVLDLHGGVREAAGVVGATVVNLGAPESAAVLGPTWHGIENGYRWMPEAATVRLPEGRRLVVRGFCPAILLRQGPVRLTVAANGTKLGEQSIVEADKAFELEFAIPSAIEGNMTVELHVDRTTTVPPDPRRLGLIVSSIELRQR